MKKLSENEIKSLPIKDRQKYKREYKKFLLYSNDILQLKPLEYINYIEQELGERALYKNKEVQKFLERYILINNLDSYKEAVYWIKNGISKKPLCESCGKETRFKKEDLKYLSTCSSGCSNKINSENKVKSRNENFINKKLKNTLAALKIELTTEFNGIKNENSFRCLKCNNEWSQATIVNGIICRECIPKISGFSIQEKEVLEYIRSIYKGEILENDRSSGVEFNIFIPELSIAIEYNGLYWHSAKFKDKKYHLNKTEMAEKNNIQLIHIFENEWINKQSIVKSIIKAKLGFSNKKIYARKCIIREVPSKESNKFLEDNHIQGKDNAPFRYGLYHNDELVQIFTLKRSHRSKDKYLELKRSASKLEYTVIGGFSKLLKYAKKIHNEVIITFADRRFSSKDNIYEKFGKYIGVTDVNHFWINGMTLKSREAYQKHKLKDSLPIFDENKTAIENCHDNNIWEIYDCGNFKYAL